MLSILYLKNHADDVLDVTRITIQLHIDNCPEINHASALSRQVNSCHMLACMLPCCQISTLRLVGGRWMSRVCPQLCRITLLGARLLLMERDGMRGIDVHECTYDNPDHRSADGCSDVGTDSIADIDANLGSTHLCTHHCCSIHCVTDNGKPHSGAHVSAHHGCSDTAPHANAHELAYICTVGGNVHLCHGRLSVLVRAPVRRRRPGLLRAHNHWIHVLRVFGSRGHSVR